MSHVEFLKALIGKAAASLNITSLSNMRKRWLIVNMKKEGDLFQVPGRSPYEEYVFLKDEKLLKAMEIDYENKKINIDLSKLYPNIDIAETLSNLTGKWIKKVSDSEVEFDDGTIMDTTNLDYKLIKPLIWWE